MRKKSSMKRQLVAGTLLSIPCSISPGASLFENHIQCKVFQREEYLFTIEGAISTDYIDKKKQRVIAVVLDKPGKDDVLVLFTGEIFNQSNPVKIPLDFIKKYCEIVQYTR